MQLFYQKHKEKISVIIALLLLIVILFPIFWLVRYATPLGDDFDFGAYLRNSIINGSSSAYEAILEKVASIYQTWQGAYFTNILAAANPYVFFGSVGFKATLATIIFIFFASILFVLRVFLVKYVTAKKWSLTLWLYVFLVFLATQFYHLSDIFYWYNSACAYTLTIAIWLIAFAFFILSYYNNKKGKFYSILSCIFIALACGGVLIFNALFLLIFFILFIGVLCNKTIRKRFIILIPPFITTIIFTIINVVAPGNYVRHDVIVSRTAEFTLQKFVNNILSFSIDTYTQVLPIVMMCALLLMTAVLVYPYVKNHPGRFGHPIIICISSILIYVGAFMPVVIGYNGNGLGIRTTSSMAFIGIVLSLFCCIYITGYFANYSKDLNAVGLAYKIMPLLAVIVFTIGISQKPMATWNSSAINESYLNGTLQEHYNEMVNTFQLIASDPNDTVIVPKLKHRSPLFTTWNLSDMQAWFNKKSIQEAQE